MPGNVWRADARGRPFGERGGAGTIVAEHGAECAVPSGRAFEAVQLVAVTARSQSVSFDPRSVRKAVEVLVGRNPSGSRSAEYFATSRGLFPDRR